jgi:hypothetical protein
MWMTARGDADQVEKAKKLITEAVIGLIVTLAAYAISNLAVNAILEPYKDAKKVTDYFYKIGTIDENLRKTLEFAGPLDFVGTKEDFGSGDSDFVSAIPMTPDPTNFLKDFSKDDTAIDLGFNFTNALNLSVVAKPVVDSASGAPYIPGEFGVLVNE